MTEETVRQTYCDPKSLCANGASGGTVVLTENISEERSKRDNIHCIHNPVVDKTHFGERACFQ